MAAAPFADSASFIRTAVAWVGRLVAREIRRAGRDGLLASAEGVSVDTLLASLERDAAGAAAPADPDHDAIVALSGEMAGRLEASRGARPELPFLRLVRMLGLSSPEATLLMVATAAAVEPRVRRLLGLLQPDDDQARIAAGVALRLLEPNAAALPWHVLAPDGRLRRFGLVTVLGGAPSVGLASRYVAVPDAVAAYVTRGETWLDERIAPYARVLEPEKGWDALVWPSEPRRLLARRLAVAAGREGESTAVLLRGAAGSGRKAAALALCKDARARLLVLDAERLPADEEGTLAAARLMVRDAALHGAVVYLENAEALRRDAAAGPARLRALAGVMAAAGGLWFLGTERLDRIDLEELVAPLSATVPEPGVAERRALWRSVLGAELDPDGSVGEALVARFPATPGDILGVAPSVRALARASGGLLDAVEVVRLVAERTRHNLRSVAEEVRGGERLDDIVLPEATRAQCLRLVELVERWETLRDDWGLGRRVLTHRGISALFSGPPGTGKTMMAGILGRHLGLDVFRIDLAQIISKWVGETEKNLGRVFAEAAHTRAVLVFDEADALFSKRTDVKQAVDRYSNAQVNYLLTRMESFEGLIILTTNHERGIDEAFVRRVQFRVRFPEPGPVEREAIWRRTLPAEVALAADVDLKEIGAQFPMAGGAIRNAALRACILASARGREPRLEAADVVAAILEELGYDPRRTDEPPQKPRAATAQLY